MKTHQQIDKRSLAMARAIVAKIDQDPARQGLAFVCAMLRHRLVYPEAIQDVFGELDESQIPLVQARLRGCALRAP